MNEQTNLLSCATKNLNFDTVSLGATVRLLRERTGLTQTQLGDRSSLSAAEISKLENGSRKKVPNETLVKISPHLNVSVDYLLASCLADCKSDHEHFYNFEGEEIDLYKISKNLYSIDSELLLLMSTTDFLSDKDFIKFLKFWIKANRALKISTENKRANVFRKMFDDLKTYCLGFLQIITEPLG